MSAYLIKHSRYQHHPINAVVSALSSAFSTDVSGTVAALVDVGLSSTGGGGMRHTELRSRQVSPDRTADHTYCRGVVQSWRLEELHSQGLYSGPHWAISPHHAERTRSSLLEER
jgi:hypothetical protein